MCGIAGFLDATHALTDDAARALALAMSSTLRHRGPDDEGVWVDTEVGLGLAQRRLAIVDLSPLGHQPMVSADGRHVLNFNGEAYNHEELRGELQREGVAFRGASDTEVFVEAVARWGLGPALDRTDGMFAFAVWDREERSLRLVRDRVGEKPLYYAWVGRTLVFGSELKALRAFPGFSPAIDRTALDAFLRYSYIPAPRTIYEGVSKLLPGSILDVAADGTAGEPRSYWSFADVAESGCRSPLDIGDADAVDVVEEALRKSVGLRMLADVPVGAFLSGGLDSSTIVALMQAQSGGTAKTFTIGFDDSDYDETAHAAAVARHLGTDHTELRATPQDALDLIPTLATTYDEPFADSSQLPTMLVAALTRRHVTVGLSGDAGDELFGGYVRHGVLDRLWRRQAKVPKVVRRMAAGTLSAVRPSTWDRGAGVARSIARGRVPAHAGEKAHKLARVLRAPDLDAAYDALAATWPDSVPSPGGSERRASPPRLSDLPVCLDVTERVMLRDATSYLPDDILTKVDRASMAVSLEARVPMLDHRLIELVWRLPRAVRFRPGETKWILRAILARHVPTEITDRPKMGFAVPVAEWLRGPLRTWADDLLAPGAMRAAGYLDPEPVATVWRQHLEGSRDHASALWSVLMFQAWLQEGSRAMPGTAKTPG
ncbi:MAG TPA: asparagine synthase (glutamine-hydrolyzing) [Acidimicrobiia bacterium]|nr:asparagine synthase (glutamine-hydrolyzing) [Acidimicrobiia bacterium]